MSSSDVIAPSRAAYEFARWGERLTGGGSFALDAPDHVPAVWGAGQDVLWSEGEPMFLVSSPGLGKTTITQQVIVARVGDRDRAVLGFPVARSERPVLYLACDRPMQSRRSMRRMVSDAERDRLDERIRIWQGPLPFNLVEDPLTLAGWAGHLNAGTVVIESLGNVAMPLSEDKIGAAVAKAMQAVVAAGVELVVQSHPRKNTQGAESARARTIDDVYGSAWITAAAGSVILLSGDPGSPVVELRHVKQPAGEVGPLTVIHDNLTGTSRAVSQVSVADILEASPVALGARDVALQLHTQEPSRTEIEKTRRRLDALVAEGGAVPTKGEQRTDPVTYSIAPR